MRRYTYREGTLDTVRRRMKTVAVEDGGGQLVGRVVRGEIPGCEGTGTFRWESPAGDATQVGVRKMTVRSVLGRLLRPTYTVTHTTGAAQAEAGVEVGRLKDRIGENILYFAVEGTVDGHRVVAMADWDGTVTVDVRPEGAKKVRIGRFSAGGLVTRTQVLVDEDALAELCDGADPRSTALFGLLILLPFLHRIYTEESSLIEDLLG